MAKKSKQVRKTCPVCLKLAPVDGHGKFATHVAGAKGYAKFECAGTGSPTRYALRVPGASVFGGGLPGHGSRR